MTNPDSPWRDGHDGKAAPGQLRAARKWASRFGRWHGVSTEERQADFDTAETRDEREKWKNS